MGSVFEFLFKYPTFVFNQGDFTFAASRSMTLTIAAIAVAAIGALITYRGITTEGALRDRITLVALRLAVVAVLAFCLFRPLLILKAAVPQQNFIPMQPTPSQGGVEHCCPLQNGLVPVQRFPHAPQ